MNRLILLLAAGALLFSACSPVQPAPTQAPTAPLSPYPPRPGDDALRRGNVYLDQVDLLIMESYPIQVSLSIQGSLPTPCHQLRVVVSEADEENRIQVELYSLVDPVLLCVQVLEPFSLDLPLGAFSTGHYEVWINDERVGEFDA